MEVQYMLRDMIVMIFCNILVWNTFGRPTA